MRARIRVLMLAVVTLSLPLPAQTGRYAGPIVDVHVHAWSRAGIEPRMRELDANRVVFAVVNGPDSVLKEWMRRQPARTMPSLVLPCVTGMVRPCYPGDAALPALEWVRAEVAAGRLQALGELLQQYAGMAPTDPRLAPYFALAEELDLPVGIHLALAPPRTPETVPTFRTYLGKPHLLEDVLAKHPKLRVYIMHAGYPYIEETIALLYIYPNVFVDVSALGMPQFLPREVFHAYLHRLTELGLHGRVMYGSDYPGASQPTIDAIDSAPFLSTDQKRDIFCRNAVKFFRLTGVSCD